MTPVLSIVLGVLWLYLVATFIAWINTDEQDWGAFCTSAFIVFLTAVLVGGSFWAIIVILLGVSKLITGGL